MFTNEKFSRRSCLEGLSLGVGGALFAPLLQKLAAAANGNVTPPKRFIFFTLTNGFQESGAIPVGWKRGADAIRQPGASSRTKSRRIIPAPRAVCPPAARRTDQRRKSPRRPSCARRALRPVS